MSFGSGHFQGPNDLRTEVEDRLWDLRLPGLLRKRLLLLLRRSGLDVTVEDNNSRGRLDMAVRFNGNVSSGTVNVPILSRALRV